jgi:hypothetical protein
MVDGRPARAARFAVLLANNQGWSGEARLRFAHRDAHRLADTLRELGGFPAGNVKVIRHATPSDIKLTLRWVVGRLQKAPHDDHLVLFYYSGHADEERLHPGKDKLSYKTLRSLLAAVPAKVRVALIDACRSGAITSLKGRPGPGFDVRVSALDRVSGDVLITSAGRGENAQESARLEGSFFTSNVITGLRGAADVDRDGRVTLAELYDFAYRRTIGLTSGTLGGTQHPSFRFDLEGRGAVVLSQPRRARACLLVGKGARTDRYLVLRAGDDAVVAEAPTTVKGTIRIGVRAGRYKVRYRTSGGIFEQQIELLAGECKKVQEGRMRRVILPETLSKGELVSQTWSAGLGYGVAVANHDRANLPLHHLALTLRIPLGSGGVWALRPRLRYGRKRYEGQLLTMTTDLAGVDLAFTRDFPLPFGLLGVGAFAGYLLVHQDLDPLSPRWSSGVQLGATGSWSIPLSIFPRTVFEARMDLSDVMLQLGDPEHGFNIDFWANLLIWW